MRLTRGFTYLAAVSLVGGTALAVTVPHALAAADNDNLSPASTKVVGTSINFTAKGTINGVPITIKCKKTTLTATTPATGLGPVTVKEKFPTGSCTDSLGGTDTVKTFGTWKLTFLDSATETQSEPNSGDMLSLMIPSVTIPHTPPFPVTGGATFTSSILPSCTVIVAPNTAFTFNSAYDDVKTATVSVKLPVKGVGCGTTATSQTNATFTLSPGLQDLP